MLLLNKVIAVDERSSSSLITIDEMAPFCERQLGVPAWIGLEYMGQTAALIAGYQLQQGLVEPHLGFLLGTRSFTSACDYFELGSTITVSCAEKVLVGDDLATFDCVIEHANNDSNDPKILAEASLSVFRRQTK